MPHPDGKWETGSASECQVSKILFWGDAGRGTARGRNLRPQTKAQIQCPIKNWRSPVQARESTVVTLLKYWLQRGETTLAQPGRHKIHHPQGGSLVRGETQTAQNGINMINWAANIPKPNQAVCLFPGAAQVVIFPVKWFMCDLALKDIYK